MLIVLGEQPCSRTLNCISMPDLGGCLCKNHLRQIVKNPMLKVTRNGPVKALFYLELYSISSYLASFLGCFQCLLGYVLKV